jgi:D-glycero-D-manno-heptose 1,7-bisphosphate phosphatase
MQVVILAGGLGTRLRPLTLSVPKPMAPIHGRPFLEYQIDWVKQFGFDRVLLLTGYLGERVQAHFQDGRRWGVSMSYSRESSPLKSPRWTLKDEERTVTGAVVMGDTPRSF